MAEITAQTRENLLQAVHRAVASSIVRESSDTVESALAGESVPAHATRTAVLFITISSFTFRLLIAFQVEDTPATRAYFVSEPADQPLAEAFSEVANMCCGALNHELARSFPHLGMSIPYVLGVESLAFLGDLRPAYRANLTITINQTVRVQMTLCLCCTASLELVSGVPPAVDNAGELQMF